VLASLASTALAVFPHGPAAMGFGGFWWLGILVPLFWILVIVLIFSLFGRRMRRHMGEHGPMHHASGRSAEVTLAERFAQGDIDEKDYRARLEVLRANNPTSS